MKKRFLALLFAAVLSATTAYAQPVSDTSAADEAAQTETTEETASQEASDEGTEATAEPETVPQSEMDDGDDAPQPTATQAPDPTATPEATTVPEPTATPDPATSSDHLDITIQLKQHTLTVSSLLQMDLYYADAQFAAHAQTEITPDTETAVLHFDLPVYEMGTTFYAEFVGLSSITFYDDTYVPEGGSFVINTYMYTDDNGVEQKADNFIMTGDTIYNKEVFLFTSDGNQLYLSPGSYMAGDKSTAMIPVKQVAQALGLNVAYRAEYDTVDVYIGDKILSYKLGSTLMNVFGQDEYTTIPTCVINGTSFVTVQSLADAFGSEMKVWENDERRDIMLGDSSVADEYYDQYFVNRQGISSNTGYLIWVSKSEYKVRTYSGSKGRWLPVRTATCAIGAPSTPTVTGQFTYFSKERWDYNGYYVGPVMRFYNGYALHSTLLNYDGSEYDGRVGVQISHGCVRMHPADINWLASNIPYGTKIYITN